MNVDPDTKTKYPRTEINIVDDLSNYLKQVIKPCLLNWNILMNGREIDTYIKLRPRELFGLFITSVISSYATGIEHTIAQDPEGGDGCIFHIEDGKGTAFFVEQTIVLKDFSQISDVNHAILKAIKQKGAKGKEYMRNRDLLVLCDYDGNVAYEMITDIVQKDESLQFYMDSWSYK